MKKITSLIVIFWVVFASIAHSSIEDEFLKGILQYLAKSRNMNLIAYSGEQVGEIGRLYYIEEPNDVRTLNRWSKQGIGLKLFLYNNGYELDSHVEYQREENYIIGTKYADYLGAELNARLMQKGIDINAFKTALRKANITFTVYRKLVPASIASDAFQPDKRSLITRFNDFGQGTGILMPFQELILADFKYNRYDSLELKALLDTDILETIKSRLNINLIRDEDRNLNLPASATIAIKALPVYFKSRLWWGIYTN